MKNIRKIKKKMSVKAVQQYESISIREKSRFFTRKFFQTAKGDCSSKFQRNKYVNTHHFAGIIKKKNNFSLAFNIIFKIGPCISQTRNPTKIGIFVKMRYFGL